MSGILPGDFAFHTEKELSPWWQVDLGAEYPLEVIVVENRLGACKERVSSLTVEASADNLTWTLLHSGLTVFGSKHTDDPFMLWISGAATARYVRLSLREEGILHLSQVEIYVKEETVAFLEYCKTNDLDGFFRDNAGLSSPYIVKAAPDGSKAKIVGLDISYSARFGNLMIQYINAAVLARKTGLRYVRLGSHALFDVRQRFEAHGLVFLPRDEPLPSDGCFLSGTFFISDPFVPQLMPFLRFTPDDERLFTQVAQEIIRPFMLTGIPLPDESHPEDEVTVHMRSGDVFAPYTPVVRGYRQPPLSFYTLVISRLCRDHGVRRARLVFEDRGNPCVDALEAWLWDRGITTRLQCGSLHQDMSALIDAPHLVLGHGTFGYAACRLSKRVKTLHYFEPELGGAYGSIDVIDRVFSVSDALGGYLKAYEYAKPFNDDEGWFNRPEDRALMLSYPVEALTIFEFRSANMGALA